MSRSPHHGQQQPDIDKRDFDQNRPLLSEQEAGSHADDRSNSPSGSGWRLSREDGLLNDVVGEIVERDRRRLAREIVRISSFVLGVITCLGAGSITAFSLYGPLFLTRLHYTQLRVNAVSIAAEVSMYLPVPLFGYLCDRYSPSPLALFSGVVFGTGYFLAAFTYRSGPPPDAGGEGWPFWVMIVAFVAVGTATSSMYLAAVTTCAKNFGRGKHKGIMLAVPIAGFGLSGMWQSQVGTYLLCERLEDGSRGDVDVFRYFLFLGALLLAIGIIGTFGLRIVDDEEERYIDATVDELERSGLLDESEFFRSGRDEGDRYGTFSRAEGSSTEGDMSASEEEREAARLYKVREEEERQKKTWLLNYETRTFLADHTMWWLALGFFLVTGPGEAYINNLGTIVQTLTPGNVPANRSPAGLPATHVTTIALTSTVARLLTGSLSDYFAPPASHLSPSHSEDDDREPSTRLRLSRLSFLLPSAFLLLLGYLLLATPLPVQHPELSHLTTALVGLGYGSAFSLVPIIISVVWGVENFGTNWGIVAMVPAVGAAFWGVVYSQGYQDALDGGSSTDEGECRGWRCFGFWAVGCTVSVGVAMVAWCLAWRAWRRRGVVV